MGRSSLKNVMRLLNEANTKSPPEAQFLRDLKKSIEMTSMKTSRKPSKTYKPSSMNCVRNMYYQVMGEEQDEGLPSYTLVGICNSGTDIHVRVQTAVEQMKENGMDCEYIDVRKFVIARGLMDKLDIVSQKGMETKLYHKELNMSFMCDGIIRYQGKYYILEIKTESSYKFQNRAGVDPKHFNQGVAYSLAFGLDDVIFVYISRDILDMKSFMFHVSDDMKHDLVGKITYCDDFVSKGQVPPKPKEAGSKFCQYCSYMSRCAKE